MENTIEIQQGQYRCCCTKESWGRYSSECHVLVEQFLTFLSYLYSISDPAQRTLEFVHQKDELNQSCFEKNKKRKNPPEERTAQSYLELIVEGQVQSNMN